MILTQEEIDKFAVDEERDSPSAKDYLGGFYFRDRMELLARRCCEKYPGDIIEIGVYSGDTSIRFVKLAKEFGRKFIAIDIWQGDPYYRLWECEALFMEKMKPYMDIVEILKVDAHTEQSVIEIMKRKYCFALSDDGHKYEYHLSELSALLPVTNGIVVADDVYYEPDVKNAIRDSVAKNPGWNIMYGKGLREGYMVKGD
jgi:cephalosporin hydroxylase